MNDEQRQRTALVRDVCRLGAYFSDRCASPFSTRCYDHRLVEHSDGDMSIGGYTCNSERLLTFTHDGTVKLLTWETSGHNGDPYNERESVLSHPDAVAALEGLRDRLRKLAVEHEAKLLEERQQREVETEAGHILDAKLVAWHR